MILSQKLSAALLNINILLARGRHIEYSQRWSYDNWGGGMLDADSPDKDIWNALAKQYDFTPREIEVLQALTKGLSNKRVADQLCLSAKTVEGYLTRIYRKLGVTSRCKALNCIQVAVSIAKNEGFGE